MTTATKSWTDEERVAAQQKLVEEHIGLENAGQRDKVLDTFVKEGMFYDVVPGIAHLEGAEGVNGFYEMLFDVLPDIHIVINHEYDVPGCCVREGVVTGTHSAEFAGVPASGRPLAFAFCAMYIFGDDPTKLVAERAYWDNDGLMRQMRGELEPQPHVPWESGL